MSIALFIHPQILHGTGMIVLLLVAVRGTRGRSAPPAGRSPCYRRGGRGTGRAWALPASARPRRARLVASCTPAAPAAPANPAWGMARSGRPCPGHHGSFHIKGVYDCGGIRP